MKNSNNDGNDLFKLYQCQDCGCDLNDSTKNPGESVAKIAALAFTAAGELAIISELKSSI